VDAEGNIVRSDDAAIRQIAEANGLSPDLLGSIINTRIDELEELQSERLLDALKALKTQAETERIQFQTERGELLLPFELQKKQADVQKAFRRASHSVKSETAGPSEFVTFLANGSAVIRGNALMGSPRPS